MSSPATRGRGDRLRRREFIALLGGAAVASPLDAWAQTPSKRPLIGFLAPASKATSERFHDGLPQGMRELGYLEARDYTVACEEYRLWGMGAGFARQSLSLTGTSRPSVCVTQ